MKAYDKIQEILLQHEEYGHLINEPQPLRTPYKIDLPRTIYGYYHLDVSLIYDHTIEKLEEAIHVPIELGGFCNDKLIPNTTLPCFDNTYLVFSVTDLRTKIKQQHYFRLVDAMYLCQLARSAYTGNITSRLIYHSQQHRKLESRIKALCSAYENLPVHLGICFSFEKVDPPTPEEQKAIDEIMILEEELEALSLQSRKKSYSEKMVFKSVSLSGGFAPTPLVHQSSFCCSSCVVGFKPNIDFDKPAWKIAICNSFMPIEKEKGSRYDAFEPIEMANLQSQGLLLTIRNFYSIMKTVDAIVVRWINGQL